MIIGKYVEVEIDDDDIKKEFNLTPIKERLENYVMQLQKECYIYVGGCDRTPKTILRDLEDILKGA